MTKNSTITIFHKSDANAGYEMRIFPRVAIRFLQVLFSDRDGVNQRKSAIFRIPCAKNTVTEFGTIRIQTGATEHSATENAMAVFDISLGDYIMLGEGASPHPPKEKCFHVTEMRANLRGANPHIMLKGR